MGYASTDLATLNFNTNLAKVMSYAGAPDLKYVPDRSALLAIYYDGSSGTARIRASTALLASNLTLTASWVQSTNLMMAVDGVHISDPYLLDLSASTTKTPKLLLSYNYNQGPLYQAWSGLTLNQFYDRLTAASIFWNPMKYKGGSIEVSNPNGISQIAVKQGGQQGSASWIQAQRADGTVLMQFGGTSPYLGVNSGSYGIFFNGMIAGKYMGSTSAVATYVPLAAKGAASQSADLFQAIKSDNTLLGGFNKDGNLYLAIASSPASNAACTAGTFTWDTGFLYICTASGAWKRAALTGSY
jgi:hypothetical protein